MDDNQVWNRASIIGAITRNGYYLLQHCFLVSSTIIAWSPRDAAFRRIRLSNNSLFRAAVELLKQEERVLSSTDLSSIRSYAELHSWEGGEFLNDCIPDLQSLFVVD